MKGILELEGEGLHTSDQPQNLMIVDCLNLSFRYKHRGQSDFAADYLRTISSLARSYEAKEVILTADWRSSAYRKHLFPEYKANRKERFKDQTEEEKQKTAEFFEGYEKALELCKLNYPLLRFEFVEADDLASYLVSKVAGKYEHTWLISTDKDWDLLLSDKVSRFSYVTRREYTIDNFYDEHGCDGPEQYVSMKVLQGDAKDNVAGVPGIGAKRAYNLIREFGTAFDIYVNLPLEGNQKFIQALNASEELIPTNYELLDLLTYSEEAIAFPNKENLTQLKEFCEKL